MTHGFPRYLGGLAAAAITRSTRLGRPAPRL